MKPEKFLKQNGFLSHTVAFQGPIADVFGQKPQVAAFLPTDPLQELYQLMQGEIKDWPQITELSNLYETYMLGAMNEAIPGFSDILKQGGTDTADILKAADPLIHGEIPPDVAAQVTRSAAFQSLGAGTLGGPMGTALTARDLGITSLDLMTQGANLAASGGNAAQRWAQIASGMIMPPSQNMYSPEWFSTFMAQQRAAKQATQQYKYNVAAAPDPAAAGISGTLMNLLGAYLGHGMGGGGSITPSYSSIEGGVVGGQQTPVGTFGGTSVYNATQGGYNAPWGTNYGGAPIPYIGGNVYTPSGAAYGTGAGGPVSDVTQPGYYNPGNY